MAIICWCFVQYFYYLCNQNSKTCMIMNTFLRHILAFCLILAPFFCMAQNQDPSSTPVVFSQLTLSDGLSSNTVRAVIQDKKGYILVGTSKGLDRYDGHRVQNVRKSRSLSVTSLCEMGDTVWVGTENGLYLYLQRVDSLVKYKSDKEKIDVSSLNVTGIQCDKKGNLWLSTIDEGIAKIDTRNDVLSIIPTPKDGKRYGCILVDKSGDVWAMTNWEQDYLIHYNNKKNCFEPFRLLSADGSEQSWGSGISLAQDHKGRLLFGDWNGNIVAFDGKTHKAKVMLSAEKSKMFHVHSVEELLPGYFLIGSDNGLLLFDETTNRITRHTRENLGKDAISDNFVYPIMRDREGGVWVGTYYGGLNYTHPVSGNFLSFQHSDYSNSVSGNVINHFCEDGYGRLWIASDDGGLCYYDSSTHLFTPFNVNLNVHALCLDGENLYVGTYAQGFDVINLKTLQVTHVPYLTDEEGKRVDASSYAIEVDDQRQIWVGTYSGIVMFDRTGWNCKRMKRFDAPVTDIVSDRKHNIWVATDGKGVWRYSKKNNTWKQYADFCTKTSDFNESVAVYSVYEDKNGALWIAASKGLFCYDSSKDTFIKKDIFTNDFCAYGLTGNDDFLWITTSAGLVCYNLVEQKLTQVFKGGGNIVSIDFLQDAICRVSDGRIYVGTTNGFFSFSPRQMSQNNVKPEVVFTGFEVFNKPMPAGSELLPEQISYADELRLSYRESVFRIYFSAMSYLQPSDNLYSYYLEGFEKEWNEAGNHHSVTYTNLEPGTYILHVRATNNDGIVSDEATLRIVITPPFYWNTPAKIFYLLIIIGLIILVVRRLMKRQQKKHVAEIEEIHVQKEQEIREINVQKEQEIQEINIQKEQEIQEINIQKEQEVHEARLKFMTISDKDQEFLDKMEDIIEQNFSNPDMSVDFLASEMGISRSGLFGKLKNLADVTPNEMIQVIRLKHAASLLQTKDYRVNEVCYMVGFSSPSYFAKCFQKQYGVTPAKYRE